MFCTTIVPLQLKSCNEILWQNPVPSSPRFCRPIHIQLEKETTQLCQEEDKAIGKEIDNLQPLNVRVDLVLDNP